MSNIAKLSTRGAEWPSSNKTMHDLNSKLETIKIMLWLLMTTDSVAPDLLEKSLNQLNSTCLDCQELVAQYL